MRFGSVAIIALSLAAAGAAFAAADAAIVSAGDVALDAPTLAGRLSRVPAFQLARYGGTPEVARKAYVDQVVVPELLFAAEARQRKLEQTPALHDRVRDVL